MLCWVSADFVRAGGWVVWVFFEGLVWDLESVEMQDLVRKDGKKRAGVFDHCTG